MNSPIRIEIPTPFSVGSVNSYLLLGAEPTLVDCGMKTPDALAALEAGLADNGLTVADIKHVVVTHAHVDHMGCVGWIAERSDAMIWVNEYCQRFANHLADAWRDRVEFMDTMLTRTGMSDKETRLIRRYFGGMTAMWDAVSAERTHVFPASGSIPIGELEWQVLYLPGHAAMQTGFYQPEQKWLISADCLLPITPVPVIERDPRNPTERSRGLAVHIESLHALAALDVVETFPGHGRSIENHQRLIASQIERIHKRKAECFALVASGTGTLPALTDAMYSHVPKTARFTGLSMILGYLDLLSAENRVHQTTIDDVWHFST